MALKNSKFVLIKLALLLFLPWMSFAQVEKVRLDSMFTKIYNSNVNLVENKRITKNNKPIILVSTSHCSACVKYFAKSQKHYQFIFIINNKSLLEVNRLLSFYNLKSNRVYFVVPDDIQQKKKIMLSGPTPLAFSKSSGDFHFVDYPVLNKITQEFTAPQSKVAIEFKKLRL